MVRTLAAALCLLLAVRLQLASPRALRMRPRERKRIVGGSDASIADYPWQLALLYMGEQDCGASIIGYQWALTAAHCFPFYYARLYSLRAGSSSRSSGGTVLYVADTYPHEEFDDNTGDYDIAVARTLSPFPLGTKVAIVNLPEAGYDPPVGLAGTVTGWGETSPYQVPDTLQKVRVKVAQRSACAGIEPSGRQLTPRMLCAGEPGKSGCFGDSGGPLVSGTTQVGIVSWGSTNCDYFSSAYVHLGKLRSWITEVTGV